MKLNRSILLKAAWVAAVYMLLDWLSAYPAVSIPNKLEAIWLPCGFLFAILMRSDRKEWGALLAAGALGGFFVNLSQSLDPMPALAFCVSNPFEVFFGAWLATALLRGRRMDLSRVPDAMILSLAGIVNAVAGGLGGLIASKSTGYPMEGDYVGAVWAGSVLLSHLTVAPLILAWPARSPKRGKAIGEAAAWAAAGILMTHWGLGQSGGASGLLLFLPFPLLVGAALRTGPWGVSLAFSSVAFTALLESAHGHGPLPIHLLTPDLMLVWVQLFLATEAISILVLASASAAQIAAEGSLLESESRYRSLVEQFPDAILLREGSRIRYANPAAVALFGVPSAAALADRPLREFLDRQEHSSGELTRSGITHTRPALRERTLKTRDGRDVPVEVTDISIALPDRPPLKLDVFRDLSKRRAAEDALKRSERDFQRFFDLAPMPLILISTDEGRVLRANAPSRALFEADSSDGFRTSDFYAREGDRARVLLELREKGRVEGMEVDVLTRKGRLRRVFVSAAPLTYEGEEAILAGFMDLTLRTKTEEALRQAQKLESLGLMAGGVAHDFNNLLTALIGNLDLARMAGSASGAAEPYFDAMGATIRRASDLARQMLAYAGQARVEVRPVDLNASAQELAVLLSASMSKKIELRFDLADGLPFVEGDPVQLQQVLLNLAINAADAIGDREGTITVRTRFEASAPEADADFHGKPCVALEVVDTGAGMSPEVKARIFDPFFTTKSSGRGLGLSTLLGILKAHRATVRVESEPGKGSRFTLHFPLPARMAEQRPGSASGPFALEPIEGIVLLVDDEADIRTTAGSQLRRMGLEVVEAADGREALLEVERHGGRLALVIMDLSMPRMDGAEALTRIRETHPDLPVILSSGFDPNQRTPELLKQPRTWFLPKPYRLGDLRRIVSDVMQGA